jgi:hypothetical protein
MARAAARSSPSSKRLEYGRNESFFFVAAELFLEVLILFLFVGFQKIEVMSAAENVTGKVKRHKMTPRKDENPCSADTVFFARL